MKIKQKFRKVMATLLSVAMVMTLCVGLDFGVITAEATGYSNQTWYITTDDDGVVESVNFQFTTNDTASGTWYLYLWDKNDTSGANSRPQILASASKTTSDGTHSMTIDYEGAIGKEYLIGMVLKDSTWSTQNTSSSEYSDWPYLDSVCDMVDCDDEELAGDVYVNNVLVSGSVSDSLKTEENAGGTTEETTTATILSLEEYINISDDGVVSFTVPDDDADYTYSLSVLPSVYVTEAGYTADGYCNLLMQNIGQNVVNKSAIDADAVENNKNNRSLLISNDPMTDDVYSDRAFGDFPGFSEFVIVVKKVDPDQAVSKTYDSAADNPYMTGISATAYIHPLYGIYAGVVSYDNGGTGGTTGEPITINFASAGGTTGTMNSVTVPAGTETYILPDPTFTPDTNRFFYLWNVVNENGEKIASNVSGGEMDISEVSGTCTATAYYGYEATINSDVVDDDDVTFFSEMMGVARRAKRKKMTRKIQKNPFSSALNDI